MKRRHVAIVAVIVLVASSLSGLVAYRRGLRHSDVRAADSAVTPGASSDCVDFHDAGSHTGQAGCVAGRVVRVFTSGSGNTFLDFCADYRNCPFTSVIFASDRSKFGDLATLGGRRVELRGSITVYQGRAEIVVHDPPQIRVLP